MFAFDTPISVGTDTFDTQRDGAPLDLLGRKAFGERLSDLLGRGDQPLVVALDGGWGSGKSHFLKLWVGAHNQDPEQKARVVYFDAFERDYLDDPLISLVAAISQNQNEGDAKPPSQAITKLKSVAVKLIKPTLRIGLAAATAGVSEVVAAYDAVFDKTVEAVGEEAKGIVDTFWQREEGRIAAVEGFRTALADLAAKQPLILVIDELDRCRPDYALSLLEVVKHFFSVPGVRFVLGVNLQALGHSVQQRYGAGVDGVLYLQKFVHLTVGLPGHGEDDGFPHWKNYFMRIARTFAVPKNLLDDVTDLLDCVAEHRRVTLREVERICARLAILPSGFGEKQNSISLYVVSAIILETLSPDLYPKLRQGTITAKEVIGFFALDKPAPQTPAYASQFRKIAASHWSTLLSGQSINQPVQTSILELSGPSVLTPAHVGAQLRDILDTFAPPPSAPAR